jgi:signal peptidase II
MVAPSLVPARRHLQFWPVAALGLLVDLTSKHYMFSQPDLLAGGVRWIWPDHAGFQLSLNEGALFGMGQGGVWLFAACSIAAAVAIPVWLFAFGGARDLPLTVTLAAILGGVLGNLYDRVGLPGLDWGTMRPDRAGEPVYAVRDFVLLARQWPPRQRWDVWPNFNVADALLVCGAIAVAFQTWRRAPTADEAA